MKSVFLIIVLYFLTRLFNLLILPIFTDESSYLYTSVLMKENILPMWGLPLAMPVVKPPLFFLLAALAENISNNALFAGRLVSVFSGVATLMGLYALTIKLFGKKTAIVASLLYILSPFSLTYDRLALMDSLLSAFSVWIIYFTISYLDKKKSKFLLILITLCFLSLLTKQSAKFFLIMLPFLPIILRGKKGVKIFFVFTFVSLITYFLYFLFLTSSENFNFYNNFDRTYANFSLQIILNNFKAVLSWTKSYFPLIFVFIPVSIIYLLKKSFNYGLILMFWSFTPLIISIMVGNYFFPRYLLPSIIFLFPILALLFNKYLWLLFIFLVPSLIFDYYIITDPPRAPYHYNERDQFITGWPAGYGIKEAFIKSASLDKKFKLLVEGDNGHFYSSFKLFDPKLEYDSFKQNLPIDDIQKIAEEENSDYLLTNRENAIINPNYILMWNFQKPNSGVYIKLYKVR